jgi:hypothetical protein
MRATSSLVYGRVIPDHRIISIVFALSLLQIYSSQAGRARLLVS